MFTSLFGDLPPQRPPGTQTALPAAAPANVGATGASGSTDVVVDASPAQAIRRHFAEHRTDLQRASAMVTLLDPSRLWAAQMVQALSEAAGSPVQRLTLRERATLRTLAVIERTLVARRDGDALRVYHADIRAGAMSSGLEQEEITNALAEGSQLTAVIVGAMQPHALVVLLRSLLQATRQPEWRCPQLVFILPPGAGALRQRILEQHWPLHLRVSAVAEPLASAASVWNCVLGAWEALQDATAPAQDRRPLADDAAAAAPTRQVQAGAALAVVRTERAAAPLAPALNRVLAPLACSEGMLACGIVDLGSGDLLASQTRSPVVADLAGLTLALCAARQAHISMAGAAATPDEILITAGANQTLLRALPGGAALGFVALLDRHQTNLALLRFKLLDAERLLA